MHFSLYSFVFVSRESQLRCFAWGADVVIRFRGPTGRVVRSLWAMDSPAKQVMDRKFAIRSFPFRLFVQPPLRELPRVFGV